ncbi:hypothetical protein C6P11_07340 [Weissella confusa]|uniref:Collagen-like protein n=1 Tax=Weissella confusa TaxID=1583 RepID=A0A4Z0RZF3_WEICO|nr:hypothetical protein C6P11_07340 [Weissella confusa]
MTVWFKSSVVNPAGYVGVSGQVGPLGFAGSIGSPGVPGSAGYVGLDGSLGSTGSPGVKIGSLGVRGSSGVITKTVRFKCTSNFCSVASSRSNWNAFSGKSFETNVYPCAS